MLGYCGIDGSAELSSRLGWGTATFGHDAGAAVLADGEVVAAAEEERFTREKHTSRFPLHAIRYCLHEAGIDLGAVEAVCYNWNHDLRARLATTASFARAMSPRALPAGIRVALACERRIFSRRKTLADFRRLTGYPLPRQRFHFVGHHLAHAASTFYGSPFDEALVVTIDGMGESDSSLVAVGRGNRLQRLDRIAGPTSMGHLYQMVTEYLGFKPEYDEYKVMGMASYGDARAFGPAFGRVVELLPDGRYRTTLPRKVTILDRVGFLGVLEELLGPRRRPGDPIEERHKDVAAALQEACEHVVVHVVEHWRRRTGLRHLCLAGGVALNSTANGVLAARRLFDSVWIPPVPGDNGGALGAAWYFHHDVAGRARSTGLRTAYQGPGYERAEIIECLQAHAGCVTVRDCEAGGIERQVAALLAHGAVVGWFQGRMEVGPRALGNRSILADPRDPGMRDRVNARIKRRELFRPFAPAVLEEAAGEYFETYGASRSPFMLFVFPVREDKRAVIPAVTHVDGSARVQTVGREDNPRFWRLLDAFRSLTTVPVLLNTSFNVQGQPIVCSPREAVESLLSTELDALALGDFLVERSAHRPRGRRRGSGRPGVHPGRVQMERCCLCCAD